MVARAFLYSILVASVLCPTRAAAAPGVDIVYWKMVSDDVASVAVDVSGATYPGGHVALHLYLDDDFVRRETGETAFEIPDVPVGLHTVAVVLADRQLGHYLELTGENQRAVVSLRAEVPCDGPGDPDCDDDNPCSLDFCSLQDGEYRCEFGTTPSSGSCCTSRFQCGLGELCQAGQCVPCASDDQCGDPDDCTIDRCEQGSCVHEVIPGCCTLEGACDDLDPCTVDDQCVSGSCAGTPTSCSPDGDADAGMVGDSSPAGGCSAGATAVPPWWALFLALAAFARRFCRRTPTRCATTVS